VHLNSLIVLEVDIFICLPVFLCFIAQVLVISLVL
jgi:hypothetical protein